MSRVTFTDVTIRHPYSAGKVWTVSGSTDALGFIQFTEVHGDVTDVPSLKAAWVAHMETKPARWRRAGIPV